MSVITRVRPAGDLGSGGALRTTGAAPRERDLSGHGGEPGWQVSLEAGCLHRNAVHVEDRTTFGAYRVMVIVIDASFETSGGSGRFEATYETSAVKIGQDIVH